MNNTIFKAGDLITAYGTRGTPLTKGKQYKCLNGTEAGMFPDRPFVTVIDDHGKRYSCHQSRFEPI